MGNLILSVCYGEVADQFLQIGREKIVSLTFTSCSEN